MLSIDDQEEEFARHIFIEKEYASDSLRQALNYWDGFPEFIRDGYIQNRADWVNSLDVRQKIDLVAERAEPTLRDKLNSILSEIDERFFAVTQAAKTELPWEKYYSSKEWSRRVPKTFLDDDFIGFLTRNGYL